MSSGHFDYLKNFDEISNLSSRFMRDDDIPDANSEKELGNSYFKQKKYREAIDCYSRSIALSPTAVAYANRAMAYLKIKKFQEAEDDCTEALNLDDRFVKAYSRRAVARKELGKLKESKEDAEFALSLEPDNQEIKKQHAEVKSLYEKDILQKTSVRSSTPEAQKAEKSETKVNRKGIHSVSNSTLSSGVAADQGAKAKKSGEKGSSSAKMSTHDFSRMSSGQFDYLKNFDTISSLSSRFMKDEEMPDAASEKELGNEYFKQTKFREAIDCYSRSIALSPTAVAYANRAMAYLKIKKFQEAEDDCTEALNLDDRYIKAYSRRAIARKELGKLKESIEDAEFALRLEPENQEIKKQLAEVKSMYEKELLQKTSGILRRSMQGAEKEGKADIKLSRQGIQSVSNGTQTTRVAGDEVDKAKKNLKKESASLEEIEERNMRAGSRIESKQMDGSSRDAVTESVKEYSKPRKQELKASVQELASREAARAIAEAAKNINPPKTAYQFEVSWRALSGDRKLQANLLKVISPSALPQIFRNALSAPMLVDIIKCVAMFFRDDMDLAVRYLESLTKVPRFDMLILCLSSTDKTDLCNTWEEVFCNEATPMEYVEVLDNLRSVYCLKG